MKCFLISYIRSPLLYFLWNMAAQLICVPQFWKLPDCVFHCYNVIVLQLNIVKGAVTRYLICSCRFLRWISAPKRGHSNLSLLVTKQHSWYITIDNNRGTVHCLLPVTNLCIHLKFLSTPSCLSCFYLQLVSILFLEQNCLSFNCSQRIVSRVNKLIRNPALI